MVSYIKKYLMSFLQHNRYTILNQKDSVGRYCNYFFCELRSGERFGTLEVIYNAYGIINYRPCTDQFLLGADTVDNKLHSMVQWYESYDEWNNHRSQCQFVSALDAGYSNLVQTELSRMRKVKSGSYSVVDARDVADNPLIIQVWYAMDSVVIGFLNVFVGLDSLIVEKDSDFCDFVEKVIGRCSHIQWLSVQCEAVDY